MRFIKFILDHGIDRILAGLGAFLALYLTPSRSGATSWVGGAVALGCVLYAVRPE